MDELPKGMERRLVLRLLAQWRDWCGENRFAVFDDIDPPEIPEIWPHCFVLDVLGHRDDPVFRTAGEEYAAHSATELVDSRVSDSSSQTLIGASTSFLPEVLKREVPITRGGEFVKEDGVTVLYRSILLPMSDDGETMSGLLGAANCRELSD